MKSFLLTLLAILALPLAASAEPPPITRYAKIGWIGYYDPSGQRVTWLHANEVQEPQATEIIKIECRLCQGRGYVLNTNDCCGACNGNGKVRAELVNVMPARELLAKKGCACGDNCHCGPTCDCDGQQFVSEPSVSKPTKLYPTGYYWERLDSEEWGLRYDGKQVGGYRIADKTYLPFDGEHWGNKCQPPTDLPGAPQRAMQQTYLPAWSTTPSCSTGR